jgi:hypothetical protein
LENFISKIVAFVNLKMILSLWPPVGYNLPSKDEDGLLDVTDCPKGMVLSNSLSKPVIEAKVLVD